MLFKSIKLDKPKKTSTTNTDYRFQNDDLRRFEFAEGTSCKFWEVYSYLVVTSGNWVVKARWGRIGSKGQTKEFHYTSLAQAEAFVRKKISEKIRKGYKEIGV